MFLNIEIVKFNTWILGPLLYLESLQTGKRFEVDFEVDQEISKTIEDTKTKIIETLDNNKALDIVSIDLKDKSSIADHMIIASGTSSRHIQSLSEQVLDKFKENGFSQCKIEGRDSTEWKLVDGIDIVVHIFNPEKRKFYELEKIWSELIPKERVIV